MRIAAVVGVLLPGLMGMVNLSARAEEGGVYHVVLKDHRFHPANITIPAGKRVKLIVDNQQPVPAVFESFVLSREKVVTAHHKVSIYLSPLDPGTYTFFDDFHLSTKGTVTAREPPRR